MRLYCTAVMKAVGVVMVHHDGGGYVFVEPASITKDWSLRQGPLPMTPHAEYEAHSGLILIGVLKNG